MANCDDCSINTTTNTSTARCNTHCINNSSFYKLATERKIQNQCRMSGSQFMDAYVSLIVAQNVVQHLQPIALTNVTSTWGSPYYLHGQSDRALPSKLPTSTNVPTRGSSTRTTITSNKPGGMDPGGSGVDVKHGSYARYLAKKKGIHFAKSVTMSTLIPISCTSFCN